MKVLLIIQEILSTPAILVGLMAMLGLILQKKAATDVVKGTIKTIVGFLVLSAGAAFVQSGSLTDFGVLFNYAFNVNGVVPNNEAIVTTALEQYAADTAWIMMFGMLANIVLARFSRLNYIFLTGHHTLYMACMIAVVLSVGGLSGWQLILGGSLILGLTMVIFPAMAQPTMTKIAGTDEIGFGHFSTIGYWVAAQVGKLVGGKSMKEGKGKSSEDINFPKWMAFMRDTTVAISITMMVIFIVVCAVASMRPDYAEALATGALSGTALTGYSNWLVYALVCGMNFAGAIYIILSGVRLILAEIVPAFKGIADKLVPNARPAIDCPVVFPYAPNAVLIGFLVSFLGGIVGMFILLAINGASPALALPIILPGVVPHFFCGATSGVFANAEGGLKGCVIGAFVHGLLITFLPVITMPVIGALGFASTTFSDADFCGVGIVMGNIAKMLNNGTLLLVVCVVLFLIPIVYNFVAPKKKAA